MDDTKSDNAYVEIAKKDGGNVIALGAEWMVTGGQERVKSDRHNVHGGIRTERAQ